MCLKCTGLKTAAPPELPAAIPKAASLIEVLTSAREVPAEFGKLHELLIKDVILTQEGFESEKNKKLDGGCPKPKDYVRHTALTDVGCGYDISSTWPGEVRCIEVKSTTRTGSDFSLTENERQVLSDLGDKAWLYRVVVEADGGGEVVSCLQDPIRHIGSDQLTPVVWRVASEALES